MTQDDIHNYGEELIDLVKRAAQDAMRPELDALRHELLSRMAEAKSNDVPVMSSPPIGLITSEDIDDYGEDLIDLVKRAAQEVIRPELNELRQELLSKLSVRAGERSSSKISVQSGPGDPARANEFGTDFGKGNNLKTTVLFTGIATSFLKDSFVYVVSTVYRSELGGLYQTSILKRQSIGTGQMVYRIEVASQVKSAQEHIEAVRMALANPENTWNGTKDYQDDLMNEFSVGSYQRPQEMSWTDERIKVLIRAANINYQPGLISRLFSSLAR